MTLLYVFWYLLGFGSGVIASRYLTKGHPMIDRVKRSTWHWIRDHVVAVALIGFLLGALAIPAAGYVYVHSTNQTNATVQRFHEQALCQANYQQALVKVLQARADASRAAVLAPYAFFNALLPDLQTTAKTPAEQKARLRVLIAANQAANQAYRAYQVSQRHHPLPPLPDQFCSDGGSKHQ